MRKRFLLSSTITLLGLLALPTMAYADSVESTSQFRVRIDPTIALTITGNCDSLVKDDDAIDSCSEVKLYPNTFGTIDSNISVYTNSKGGYKLTVRAMEGTSLKNEEDITISAGVLNAEVGGQGIWSYKTNGGIVNDWAKITTEDSLIRNVSEVPAEGDHMKVTYGISTTRGQAAGTYSVKLTFTATAYDDGESPDEVEVPDFWKISTMQEMTESVCNSVYTPAAVIGDSVRIINQTSAKNGGYTASGDGYSSQVPETTLIDTRDGNEYRIRKLADGECWMTNNLRLTFADVNGDGIIGVAHTNGTQETEMTSDNTDLTTKTKWIPTEATQTTDTDNWQDADGEGQPDDMTRERSRIDVATNDTKYDIEMKLDSGDLQYYGTYYNWYTATAATTPAADLTAGDSVCPAGWELPRNEGTHSWQDLIVSTYHIIEKSGDQDDGGVANAILHKLPLSIPYSGLVDRKSGQVIGHGSDGRFWSATATSTVRANYLHFFGTSLTPQYNYLASNGFSVRCVAK